MEQPTADSAETRRLLQEVRAGQPGATDRLLERHRPYLLRVVEVRFDPRLRARVDPSDVVQEAQVEAVRRLDGYLRQPPMPFKLWLRQLAFDRLVMLRRQHVEAERLSVEREADPAGGPAQDMAAGLAATISSPSEQVVRAELARRVRQALDQLPEGDREVILMQQFEGLTAAEVAAVLGITPAAARKRYGRALLRLRQLLVGRGLEGPTP